MRKALWMAPGLLAGMMSLSAWAGEAVAAAAPVAAAPAAKGVLDERVDFASDNVGLSDILKLLDNKKIGYVLPTLWEVREAMAMERLAAAGEAMQQRLKGAGKVTMKVANVPLRIALKQFALAFGVECEIVEGDGYQLVVFHDEDGARLEGRGRGMGMGMGGGQGGPGGMMGGRPGGGRGGDRGGDRGAGNNNRGGNRAPGGAPAENF